MAQLKDLLVNGSARVIGSLFANLSGNVLNFGVCSTAAATAAKTVTTNGTFELITGSKILVLFSETDTSNAPTLNVNGTGAKNIKVNASDGIGKGFLAAQQYYWFIYDGTNWRTAGAGITQIIPTQYGGTGNSSFTANRVIYSNTATKLASGSITTDGAYLSNISYLSVNNDHQTSYRFLVSGASLLNGQTTVYGPLRVGRDDAAANTGYATANVGANNYIAFFGVNGDNPGGYNHTYIGESIYGPKNTVNEKSELLLFHGNDPDAGSGPDRIRLFASAIDIQVYTSALSGTWDTIRATTGIQIANFKDGMSTFSTSVTVGTSTSGALGIAQTDGAGRGISLYNGPASAMPEYGIAFAKTATFGTHGAVTSDWATYFTMSDTTTRGWIFRRGSTNVASIDGTGKLYLGYATSTANPGIYWNPYVESASDGSDVSAIYQIKSGVAGGTELRISQANDAADVINIVSPYYIYLNSKRAFKINDAWLRINEDKGFSEGIYTGSSLVRTDNQFQVGDSGNRFYANSSGNGYFSNTLGIAGTNTSYKLYVNGTTYINGTLDNQDGRLSFVQNKSIIGNTVNWNTLTTPGCYKIQMATWGNAATLHSPNEAQSTLYSYGLLFVFRGAAGDEENRVEQIYFPHQTSNDHPIYCRMHNGSSFDSGWQSWHRLARGNLAKKLTIQANGVQKVQFNNSADVTVNLGNVAQDFTGANSGNANNINADTFAGMTRQQWLNTVYPIGSIYMSVNSTLFGGSWESLGGRFLIGQDGTYTAGNTGGSTTHTHTTPATTTGGTAITVAQMPPHTHEGQYQWNNPVLNSRNNDATWSVPMIYGSGDGVGNWHLKYAGSGEAHTHSQVATTTSATSTLPPYLAVYMWKRTA